jgi:hypothetical protein
VDEDKAHLQEDLELVRDLGGVAIGEALSAVSALEQKSFAGGGFSELALEGFDFPGGDERRELGQFRNGRIESGRIGILDLVSSRQGAPGSRRPFDLGIGKRGL